MFDWLTDIFRRRPKMVPPEEQLAHLDEVAASFTDCDVPLEDPNYWNWKIACSSGLFEPPVVTPEIERRAIQSLVTGAGNLTRNPAVAELPYFRAAAMLTDGDLFGSEVTAFFDRDYCQRFWTGEPSLPPEKLLERYALDIPDGFDIYGVLICQEMGEEEADLPGVYRDEEGRYWSEYERWTIGQVP